MSATRAHKAEGLPKSKRWKKPNNLGVAFSKEVPVVLDNDIYVPSKPRRHKSSPDSLWAMLDVTEGDGKGTATLECFVSARPKKAETGPLSPLGSATTDSEALCHISVPVKVGAASRCTRERKNTPHALVLPPNDICSARDDASNFSATQGSGSSSGSAASDRKNGSSCSVTADPVAVRCYPDQIKRKRTTGTATEEGVLPAQKLKDSPAALDNPLATCKASSASAHVTATVPSTTTFVSACTPSTQRQSQISQRIGDPSLRRSKEKTKQKCLENTTKAKKHAPDGPVRKSGTAEISKIPEKEAGATSKNKSKKRWIIVKADTSRIPQKMHSFASATVRVEAETRVTQVIQLLLAKIKYDQGRSYRHYYRVGQDVLVSPRHAPEVVAAAATPSSLPSRKKCLQGVTDGAGPSPSESKGGRDHFDSNASSLKNPAEKQTPLCGPLSASGLHSASSAPLPIAKSRAIPSRSGGPAQCHHQQEVPTSQRGEGTLQPAASIIATDRPETSKWRERAVHSGSPAEAKEKSRGGHSYDVPQNFPNHMSVCRSGQRGGGGLSTSPPLQFISSFSSFSSSSKAQPSLPGRQQHQETSFEPRYLFELYCNRTKKTYSLEHNSSAKIKEVHTKEPLILLRKERCSFQEKRRKAERKASKKQHGKLVNNNNNNNNKKKKKKKRKALLFPRTQTLILSKTYGKGERGRGEDSNTEEYCTVKTAGGGFSMVPSATFTSTSDPDLVAYRSTSVDKRVASGGSRHQHQYGSLSTTSEKEIKDTAGGSTANSDAEEEKEQDNTGKDKGVKGNASPLSHKQHIVPSLPLRLQQRGLTLPPSPLFGGTGTGGKTWDSPLTDSCESVLPGEREPLVYDEGATLPKAKRTGPLASNTAPLAPSTISFAPPHREQEAFVENDGVFAMDDLQFGEGPRSHIGDEANTRRESQEGTGNAECFVGTNSNDGGEKQATSAVLHPKQTSNTVALSREKRSMAAQDPVASLQEPKFVHGDATPGVVESQKSRGMLHLGDHSILAAADRERTPPLPAEEPKSSKDNKKKQNKRTTLALDALRKNSQEELLFGTQSYPASDSSSLSPASSSFIRTIPMVDMARVQQGGKEEWSAIGCGGRRARQPSSARNRPGNDINKIKPVDATFGTRSLEHSKLSSSSSMSTGDIGVMPANRRGNDMPSRAEANQRKKDDHNPQGARSPPRFGHFPIHFRHAHRDKSKEKTKSKTISKEKEKSDKEPQKQADHRGYCSSRSVLKSPKSRKRNLLLRALTPHEGEDPTEVKDVLRLKDQDLYTDSPHMVRNTKAKPIGSCISIRKYIPRLPDELAIEEGEVLAIIEKPDYSGMYWRAMKTTLDTGETYAIGYIPISHVREINLENIPTPLLERRTAQRGDVYRRIDWHDPETQDTGEANTSERTMGAVGSPLAQTTTVKEHK